MLDFLDDVKCEYFEIYVKMIYYIELKDGCRPENFAQKDARKWSRFTRKTMLL